MSFTKWWKTSSAKAGEDYYKLRFNESEISDLRRGFLNASAQVKFAARVKKYAKMSGAIIGGCLGLTAVLVLPVLCIFAYSFYLHPSVIQVVVAAIVLIFIVGVDGFVAVKLFGLSKEIKSDLQNGRAGIEQGNLKIDVSSSANRDLQIRYSVNQVEFKVLQDAIGDEINKQFLSRIINVGDSRITAESYRFYYLPQSKLILFYEQI